MKRFQTKWRDYILAYENYFHIPVSFLRMLVSIFGILLLIGLGSLISQFGRIISQNGDIPSTLLILVGVYSISLVGLLIVWLLAPKILKPLECIWGWLCDTGVIFFSIAGILAVVVIINQIENWLLPGFHQVTITLAAPVVLISIIAIYSFAKCFIRRHRGNIHFSLLISKLGKFSLVGGLICTIIIIRTALAGYYAWSTPLLCNEAGTVMLFGNSISSALTHYDAPNNHILNSLFVFLSTQVFGMGELAVRLPAMIACLLGLVSTYVLANMLFGRQVALISLIFMATSAWNLYYSYQARGYAWVIFLALVAIGALWKTFENVANRHAWGTLIISLGLAFATLPTMLYFWASLIVLGLGVFFLRNQLKINLDQTWLTHFIFSMGIAFSLAVFGYLNPLFYLFKNGTLSTSFFSFPAIQPQTLGDFLRDFFLLSTSGGFEDEITNFHHINLASSIIVTSGIFAGLVKLISDKKNIHLYLFGSLFLIPILIIVWQSNLPFPRNLVYLLPFSYILAAYGLQSFQGILSHIFKKIKLFRQEHLQRYGLIYLLIPFFLFTLHDSTSTLNESLFTYHTYTWPAKEITQFIEDNVSPNDGIVADICLEYMVAYYINPQYHVSSKFEVWRSGIPDKARIYVIPSRLNKNSAQDIEASPFLQETCKDLTQPTYVTEIGNKYLYLCEKHK